jgi:hypothetical protein
MFVRSEKFVHEHGGRIGDTAIYGQESNYTTWRLCKMNLAVRGIDADIRWNHEGGFHKDELRDLKADYLPAIRRSTFPTRAAIACVGSSACRLLETLTTPGCNTSGATLHATARRAWCWPMAR